MRDEDKDNGNDLDWDDSSDTGDAGTIDPRWTLPRLRPSLDAMSSPVPDAPGVLLRDPLRYAEAVIVVPPAWAPLLALFDGGHTFADAVALMTRRAGGQIVPGSTIRDFVKALDESGYLETSRFRSMKREREDAFRRADVRRPTHAGTAYPDSPDALDAQFGGYFERSGDDRPGLPRAIVAPHVSPHGGVASYRAAYTLAWEAEPEPAPESDDEPVLVVLGTSHYGEPERMGVTRKAFSTPLGRVEVATPIVDELVREGRDAFVEEDYCHVPEHSIEFQIVFLQKRLRRPFRIVPILVGPFLDSLLRSRRPEAVASNERAMGALAAVAARHPELRWVLGVDMAHVGRRYGGASAMRAGEGAMLEVEREDRQRIARVCAADAEGFFELVHPQADALSWCGYSPLYAFLHAVAPELGVAGTLRHYEQWNIDPESVVSFGAIHFQ